jgi:hypothetical protein
LQHANVALLPADFLVKAFEQIGRANQRHVCSGKLHRQITSGFTNLSSMPCSDLGCWVY